MWTILIVIIIALVIYGSMLPSAEEQALKKLAGDIGASYQKNVPAIFAKNKHLNEMLYDANGISFVDSENVHGSVGGMEYIIFYDQNSEPALTSKYVFIIFSCDSLSLPEKMSFHHDPGSNELSYEEKIKDYQKPPEYIRKMLEAEKQHFQKESVLFYKYGFLLLCARWGESDYLKMLFELTSRIAQNQRE